MFHEVDFLFQWYRWSFKCLASYFTLIFRSSCPVLPFTIYCCPSVRPLVPGHFRFNSITTRWRMRALISRAVTPAPPPPFPCSAQPSAKTASSWSRLVYYIYITVPGRIAEFGPVGLSGSVTLFTSTGTSHGEPQFFLLSLNLLTANGKLEL